MTAGLARLLGDRDGLGEELRKIPVNDGGLGIDETGVEVALEHGEDALDVRIGCGVSTSSAARDFDRSAPLRVRTEDLTKSRRFMGTYQE